MNEPTHLIFSVTVKQRAWEKPRNFVFFFKPYSHITTEMYSISKPPEVTVTVSELGRVGHPSSALNDGI